MKHAAVLLLIASLLAFSGCKKEEEQADLTARVEFELRYNGEPVVMEEVFTTSEGYRMRIDRLDFYIGELDISSSGVSGAPQVEHGISLIRFDQGATRISTDISDDLDYDELSFGIGVEESINSDPNPSQYSTSHPLSDFSGMYWSWNSGYKFVQLEGKVDLTGTEGAALDHPLSIHTGLNQNYRTVSFSKVQPAVCNEVVYRVTVNMEDWFESVHTIDVATENETHTTDNLELAEKFTDNFAASLSIE